MRYVLKNMGYPWKTIHQGRKTVGKVTRNAEGTFDAVIGSHVANSRTEEGAFRMVAAKALGFESLTALQQHNAEVRASNRARRSQSNSILRDLLRDERLVRMLEGRQR